MLVWSLTFYLKDPFHGLFSFQMFNFILQSAGEKISLDVIERICVFFDCNVGDVLSFEKDETKEVVEKK